MQFWWSGALRMRRAAVSDISASVEQQSWECPLEDNCNSLIWTIHKRLLVVLLHLLREMLHVCEYNV